MAVNWKKIKNEYVTSKISQRALAKKYGVSESSIAKKSKAENWTELREQKYSEITAKVQQKTVEKIAEKQAQETVDALDFMGKLLEGLAAEYKAVKPGTGKKVQSTKDGDTIRRVEKESSIKIITEIAKATAVILEAQKKYAAPDEGIEDSGLREALYANVGDLFADGDDSDMLPEEDED